MKKLLAIALALFVLALGAGALAQTASGKLDVYVLGYEWGPAIPKLVIEFDREIDADSLAPDAFQVVAHMNGFRIGTEVTSEADVPQTVLAAQLCDADGAPIDGASGAFVRLDLAVHPDGVTNKTYIMGTMPDGTPIKPGGVNVWYDDFTQTVTLAEGANLTSAGEAVTSIDIAPDVTTRMPDVAGWALDQKFTAADGTPFNYASYAPPEDGAQNALIIWLHGAGEPGDDSTINLLCNESVDIAKSPIQDYFGGAYVLAPQCETMWMDDGDPDGDGDFYSAAGASLYTAGLQELIEAHIAANPDIDPNRVIIGGCSNGGFMTMNMLVHHPGYYAAAYPLCQAYTTDWITDAQLELLKDEAIWFVHCLADDVVDPAATTLSLMEKLEADGDLPNIHATYFDQVVDASGEYLDAEEQPYVYMAHWVWIYALDDAVANDGVSLWEFLAAQSK